MIIGKSDRRIVIQRASKATNNYGEVEETHATHLTLWAELMKTASMKESIVGNQDTATRMVSFKVRRSTDSKGVTTEDRIVYDSDTYDIEGIEEIGRSELIFHSKLNQTTY